MKTLENYEYTVFFNGIHKNGRIYEKQQRLYTADELFSGGNKNLEVPLFRNTSCHVSFATNTILSDFINIGKISENQDEVKEAKALYSIKHFDLFQNTKTLEEFEDAKQKINILDTDFPVEFINNWYLTPVFMNKPCSSPLCPDIDDAKNIWRVVFRFIESNNGLSKTDIAEFERFRSFHRINLNYKISYSCESSFLQSRKLSENEFIKNQTSGFSENYTYLCKNAKEIIFAVLHYYIMNKLSLKKCELCGKYFFVEPGKEQERFCTNTFKYTNWEGKEKMYINCKKARESIRDHHAKRHKTIYIMLYNREGESGDMLNTFLNEADKYKDKIKKLASIQNIIEYENFLFIECEKYYRRYNRVKSSFAENVK